MTTPARETDVHHLREDLHEVREDVRTVAETLARHTSQEDTDRAHHGRELTDIKVLLAKLVEHSDSAKAYHSDHETRLRALEHGWWKATGMATVVAGLLSWLASKFHW